MGWVVNAKPRPLYPRVRDAVTHFRRLGGPRGWSGRVGKISPLPDFEPLTVQPIAIRYTHYGIQAAANLLVYELTISI